MIDRRRLLALAVAIALPVPTAAVAQSNRDVPYVPTPEGTVEAMMELGEVGRDDVLYDLGSGDGRIAIAAGRRGARAIGIEIDPELVRRARTNARYEGLEGQVIFRGGDLFREPLREASVVTLYLLPDINLRLRPRLIAELRPGSRVVSHAFTMDDWRPDEHRLVNDRNIYLWIVPAVAGGEWTVTLADGRRVPLSIQQRFQDVSGTLGEAALEDATLRGDLLLFTAGGQRYEGRVDERTITGEGWSAARPS